MNSYQIHKLADGNWNAIPVIDINIPYKQTPATIKAYAQVAYTDNALMIHEWTREENYRAVEEGPLGSPCEDSCLEFFFSMDPEDPRYINIEFNSNGCQYLGFGQNGNNPSLIRMICDIEEVFAPQINRQEDGWEITYQIPYSFIRMFFPNFEAVPGKVIHANCYKCADFSEPPHYLSWNQVINEPLSFHRRACFGTMQFV